MLSVFETGDDSFRLSNSKDEEVGWIRGRALGMSGLSGEQAAIAAAVAGGDALAGWLERQSGNSEEIIRSSGRVKIVNVPGTVEVDAAAEVKPADEDWVVRGKERIARLYTDESGGGYAVEFLLPSYVRSGTVISAAQVVYNAVKKVRGAASASDVAAGKTAFNGMEGRPATAGA